jgi:hypothetical protein
MSSSENAPVVAPFRGHTCRELYKAIFEAEAPEQVVRQLPTQSLFMVIKQRGLPSCADLVSMASLEQCRLLTDFDLWEGDKLNENALWEWLALTDEADSLEILQKILKFMDLKLLAILIGRYVEVKVFEEPTDQQPGPGFHTPDKGFTWIGIHTENADHHFLLARLLALIFESSTELFYQLMATPSVATLSMLEEESYSERVKRLAAEGVPEPEVAAQIHAPFSYVEARREIAEGAPAKTIEDIRSIEPLIYEGRATRFFAELMRKVSDHDAIEMEFTYIMNAAVVRFAVDFSSQERVLELSEQVKGAINIALERLSEETSLAVREIYEKLGLVKLYRYGLTDLVSLRRKAHRVPVEVVEQLSHNDKVLFSVIACLREIFPVMPMCLNDDGSVVEQDGSLPAGHRCIETRLALKTLSRLIESVEGAKSDASA